MRRGEGKVRARLRWRDGWKQEKLNVLERGCKSEREGAKGLLRWRFPCQSAINGGQGCGQRVCQGCRWRLAPSLL